MGQALAVRSDLTSKAVRRLAQRARNAAQARRLLAIAAGLDGASREEAAKAGGMGPQTLAGLRSDHAPVRGVRPLGFRRYGVPGLEGIGLFACERAAEGLQTKHRCDRGVQKNFATRVAEIRRTLAPGTPIEVWFQDEMRVGQKNKLTYRWARTGSRPRDVHDQRTQSTYCSAQCALNKVPVPPWFCHPATARPCSCTSTRSPPKSVPAHMPFSSLIRQDAMATKPSRFPTTSHYCLCHPDHPSSTVRKTSGNYCARTGCPTASSKPSTTSSTTAALPGTR